MGAIGGSARGYARASLALVGLLLAILAGSPEVDALSPRVVIFPAGQVSDGGTAPITATFPVSVFFEYPEVMCQPSNPNCNDKTISVCVDFHTAAETATADQDFRPTSGRLNKTVTFHGPGEVSLGTIDVEIVGDSVIEGAETFKVVLTNPSGQACVNQASLAVFEARAIIVDGEALKPDLMVSDLSLGKNCRIQVTLKNSGKVQVPDSAYDKKHGVAIQMQRQNEPWGGIRLIGVDPTKKLKTPGASVTYIWFPNVANLKLKPGHHLMTVTVDKNGTLTESDENNNRRTETLICAK